MNLAERSPVSPLDTRHGFTGSVPESYWIIHTLIFELDVLVPAAAPAPPGLSAYLHAARGLGLRRALVSRHPQRDVLAFLRREGFGHLFDCIRCGEDVETPPPAPDLYLSTLEMMGFPPVRTLAVADTAEGVAAARKAGLFTVAGPPAAHAAAPEADDTLAGWEDLTLIAFLDRVDALHRPKVAGLFQGPFGREAGIERARRGA